MKRRLAFLFALPLLLCLPLLAAAALPFPQESSDLKPDSAVSFGVLPNGLRYAVRPCAEPKGRIYLRLLVLAGSLNESEQQRGLAHFIEHMAFNGTKDFPHETLVKYFQRLGMGLGDGASAFTYFDKTCYLIDLPDAKTGSVEEGLKVLTDFASGMLLEPADIDRERGVILAELRARDSVGLRTFVAESEFLFPHTLLSERLPIGKSEVISTAKREAFADFYDTWYRPERLVLVATGDFDPGALVTQITRAFSGMSARKQAREEPNLGELPTSRQLRVKYYADREAPSTTVSLTKVIPLPREADTRAQRLKDIPRTLALAMLNQRLAVLARKEGAPFITAEVSLEDGFQYYRRSGIAVTCMPEQWRASVGIAERELRKALEQGFQPAELKQALASASNALEQALRTAPTRHASSLADELMESFMDRTVFVSPETELELFKSAQNDLSPEVCRLALNEIWKGSGASLFVTGNVVIEGDAEAAIAAEYEKSRAQKLDEVERIEEGSFAYSSFGPEGRSTSTRKIEDLGITQVEFENGVRLNLKKTEFEADGIRIGLRLGSGQLTEPNDKPGLGLFASNTLIAGGLGKHSIDELQRLLAGKTLGLDFAVLEDALQFSGVTSRRDLLLQLQLFSAYIKDPAFRPEALRIIRKGLDQYYTSLEHAVEGPLQTTVPRLLAGGDPRFGLPSREILLAYELSDAKDFLAPQLARGAIEISIVGDIDEQAAIHAVAATLGTLPKRDPRPALDERRIVRIPGPVQREFSVDTRIPSALVVLEWPTADGRDRRLVRRLNVLAVIFQDRLFNKVREDMGEAYSPDASNDSSQTYNDFGFLQTYIAVAPDKAAKIGDVIASIAADLSSNGVSEDELLRAKQPLLTSITESLRNNGYWLNNVLLRSQEKPVTLDWHRQREKDFASISKSEIDALAKAYLAPSKAFRFIVVPSHPEQTSK
jgi:zinc protease